MPNADLLNNPALAGPILEGLTKAVDDNGFCAEVPRAPGLLGNPVEGESGVRGFLTNPKKPDAIGDDGS